MKEEKKKKRAKNEKKMSENSISVTAAPPTEYVCVCCTFCINGRDRLPYAARPILYTHTHKRVYNNIIIGNNIILYCNRIVHENENG